MTDRPFDTFALLAQLESGEMTPDELRRHYRDVFGTRSGRLVLAHILIENGVGRKYGGPPDNFSAAYQMGAHDAACDIRDLCGFTEAATAVFTMTGRLEGSDDEREQFGAGSADLEPEPWG